MKRLLSISVAVVLLGVLAGCAADTQPATNVGQTSATLNANASCSTGEKGTYFWRWRPVGWPEASGWWTGGNTPFDCTSGPQNKQLWYTATGLLQGTQYAFQLCSLDAVTVGTTTSTLCAAAAPGSQLNATSFDTSTSDTFTTQPYDPSTDTGQSWTTSGETDIPVHELQPGEYGYYGVGTGWACGWIPQSWKSVNSAGLLAFKGTMGPTHMCWGTGHNRGSYKYVDQPQYAGPISAWGEYTGWRYDGAVPVVKGPYTNNGKEIWIRTLQWHSCQPPKGPCLLTTHKVQIVFKNIVWVDTNNIAHVSRYHTQYNLY